jgi:hypothetical protein
LISFRILFHVEFRIESNTNTKFYGDETQAMPPSPKPLEATPELVSCKTLVV